MFYILLSVCCLLLLVATLYLVWRDVQRRHKSGQTRQNVQQFYDFMLELFDFQQLDTVQQYMEKMGGSITVNRDQPQIAVFTVTMPKSQVFALTHNLEADFTPDANQVVNPNSNPDRSNSLPQTLIKPTELTVSSLDEEFIGRVISEIEANISNPSYSVVQLSAAVGMTRGTLYKKLMNIVGKSPVEFMRIVRLKRGKNLLDQGRTNISEVADKVGFSPKVFAQYFRKMYGCPPSEYLKQQKSNA